MIGLPKSSSVMPVARQSARAPAIVRPCVEVLDRSSTMEGSLPPRRAYDTPGVGARPSIGKLPQATTRPFVSGYQIVVRYRTASAETISELRQSRTVLLPSGLPAAAPLG